MREVIRSSVYGSPANASFLSSQEIRQRHNLGLEKQTSCIDRRSQALPLCITWRVDSYMGTEISFEAAGSSFVRSPLSSYYSWKHLLLLLLLLRRKRRRFFFYFRAFLSFDWATLLLLEVLENRNIDHPSSLSTTSLFMVYFLTTPRAQKAKNQKLCTNLFSLCINIKQMKGFSTWAITSIFGPITHVWSMTDEVSTPCRLAACVVQIPDTFFCPIGLSFKCIHRPQY